MKRVTVLFFSICLITILASCKPTTNTMQNAIKTETTHPDVTIIDATLSKSSGGIIVKAKWANNSTSQIVCGKKFNLEIKNDKDWESLSEIDGTMFTLEQVMIYPDHLLEESNETNPLRLYSDNSFELLVSEHYHIERDCEYRISIDFQSTSDGKTYKAYLYFST